MDGDDGLFCEQLSGSLFTATQVVAQSLYDLSLRAGRDIISRMKDCKPILHIVGINLNVEALGYQLIRHFSSASVEALLENFGIEILGIFTFAEEKSVSFCNPVIQQFPGFFEIKAQFLGVKLTNSITVRIHELLKGLMMMQLEE